MNNDISLRISDLINTLKLKKVRFAERLSIDQSYVTQLTNGRRTPSDLLIAAICREFNVNETWLRTGEGEMFIPAPSDTLDMLTREYELSHDARVLVEEFVNLKPEMQRVFIDFARKAAESFRSEPTAPAGQERPEVDIAAKLEELERQNQELAAKVAAMEEEERDEQLKADFGAALSALQSGLAGNAKKAKK